MIVGTVFPDGGWDPLLKAGAIAAAFATQPNWQKATDPGWWFEAADYPARRKYTASKVVDTRKEFLNEQTKTLTDDIAGLWKWYLSGERHNREQEVKKQAVDISPYWANLLACSSSSMPATWSLVLIGLQVGGMIAAYHKLHYRRARAVQVWAPIAPMIATPPHPSYPSGHALQGMLIADCVSLAVPQMAAACEALGERIGINREIAGVHFPSDTRASHWIAEQTMPILKTVDEFNEVVELARNEWGTPKDVSSPIPPPKPLSQPKGNGCSK